MIARCFLSMIALLAAAGTDGVRADSPKILAIDNPGDTLGKTRILIEIDARFPTGDYSLWDAKQQADAEKVRPSGSAEIFRENQRTYLFAVLDGVNRGHNSYAITNMTVVIAVHKIDVERDKDSPKVTVRLDHEILTSLRTDLGPKPILYPLHGPNPVALSPIDNLKRNANTPAVEVVDLEFIRVPMTRDYPMKNVTGEDKDHPHHRSFWFTHGKVNGVDFWSEEKGHGSIKQTAILSSKSGHGVGILRTTDDWLDASGKKVCEDERLIRFYAEDHPRMFDFEVTIKATNGPVTFGDTKEGMFGMRLASSMDVTKKTGGRIVNAEGITDTQAWGKASPWVDYSGPIGGKTYGVAILDHPTSFRHPTTWHVRDYGLFAANPFGWKDFGQKASGDYTVPAGESITFKYRIILHEGNEKAARIGEAFRSFSAPLGVEIR